MNTHLPLTRALACVVVLATTLAHADSPKRPNIVLILSDDMGFSDIGCYGSEIQTPNLDALASGGVRFTQFYNTGRCCPTRAALLTGLYSHQAGIGHMIEDKGLDGFRGELNNHCVTIAEAVKPAGYHTYAVGKWHVCRNVAPEGDKHDWPLQRGFERYYGTITGAGSYFDPGTLTRDNKAISAAADPEYKPASYYYTDAIADNAVRFATEHARDHRAEPFFMYVAFTAAHWPLHAKDSDIAKYKGRYDAGYEAIRQERFEKEKKLGVIEPDWQISKIFGDWTKVADKGWEARCMEVYAAQIDCLDQGVGRIVEALKKNGQFDNTVLFFLQDNGACAEAIGRTGNTPRAASPSLPVITPEALRSEVRPKQTREGFPLLGGPSIMPGPGDTFISYGEAWANVSNTPFRLYKHFEHEGGISTPFIAHLPAGSTRHGVLEKQPGHLVDVMATCVDFAGAEYPKTRDGQPITPMQGVSLIPALQGAPLQRPNPLFFEHEGNRAIRDGKWKLVAQSPSGKWKLYDTETDRTEMHDLAGARPEMVQQLAAKWEAFGKQANALPWPWKPAYGQSAGDVTPSGASHFDLKQGDDLAGEKAPSLAHHGFSLRVEITEPAADGVLVAQGGSTEGFSLYFKGGKPALALRHGGKLDLIQAEAPAPGPVVLTAKLAKGGAVALSVGDRTLATGKSSLFKRQPQDGLQVGQDTGGAVGEYTGPFPFKGKLGAVTFDLAE